MKQSLVKKSPPNAKREGIKIKSSYLLCLVLLLFALLISGCQEPVVMEGDAQDAGEPRETAEAPALQDIHDFHDKAVINTEVFLSPASFFSLLPAQLEQAPYPKGADSWKAMVAPHHALAGHLTAEAIGQLQENPPPMIFLIGPNHSNEGHPALTTKAAWQTAGGICLPEEEAIDALLSTGLVQLSDELFQSEHSMGVLIPFMAYYLPETRVVPLALHYKYPLEEGRQLIEALLPWLEQGGVMLASIDFSHGLNMAGAEARDALTAAYLEDFDAPIIAGLDSTYLDSPTIMALLLEYVQEQGRDSFTLLQNTNSGRIMRDSRMEVTSYFTLLY